MSTKIETMREKDEAHRAKVVFKLNVLDSRGGILRQLVYDSKRSLMRALKQFKSEGVLAATCDVSDEPKQPLLAKQYKIAKRDTLDMWPKEPNA